MKTAFPNIYQCPHGQMKAAMIPSRNFHYRLSADPRILLARSEPSSAIHDSEHVCRGRQNLSHGRKTACT